ncbi:glycosyltransferase family 2 protein [Pediococcus siamensis]|uniref:glycosyltransferase family 2 protein n=1 Tax=Pediococcus siamensis TaxID=381829 RepID=UPI00399F6013
MEKLVSIVIPYYQDTAADLSVVLSSINNQVGIDFDQVEVILVNDGGTPIHGRELFSYFSHLSIRTYHYPKNQGAGYARMVGTEAAVGKYVMYMDADDQFHYVGALLDFFNVVKYHGDHQIIIGAFMEESHRPDVGYRYYRHESHDWKSAYAKWFSQDYLRQIQLTWRSDLRVFEDTYFVGVACECASDIYYLDSVVYTWMWHPNTTVRKDGGKDFYHRLDQWALSHRASLEKIQQYRAKMLPFDFTNYMADLYLREQLYPPLDADAYQREQQKLLVEFSNLWLHTKTDLERSVKKMMTTQAQYVRFDTQKLPDFIRHQEDLLGK